MSQRLLNRSEAADYLKSAWGLSRSRATLAKMAVSGHGPDYHRSGRDALYTTVALDAYAVRAIGPAAPIATQHKVDAILHRVAA